MVLNETDIHEEHIHFLPSILRLSYPLKWGTYHILLWQSFDTPLHLEFLQSTQQFLSQMPLYFLVHIAFCHR